MKDLITLTGHNSLTLDRQAHPRIFHGQHPESAHPESLRQGGRRIRGLVRKPRIEHPRGVQPVHVAAYVEDLPRRIAAPSVKVQLADVRMLFEWLVVGQVMPMNPAAAAVRSVLLIMAMQSYQVTESISRSA